MFLLTSKLWALPCLLYLVQLSVNEAKSFVFTRFVCEVRDRDFCIFKKCSLEHSPGTAVTLMNIYIEPLQPLQNITVKIKLLRKNKNSYRQFYYETLIDICEFLKNYKRQVPWGIMYQAMFKYTNVNHTCPYHHDIIVKNLGLVGPAFEAIPLPNGDYLLQLIVLRKKIPKIKIDIFFVRK